MAISCVYCGGRHDSSAEVRQCWELSQQPDPPTTPTTPITPITTKRAERGVFRAMPQLGRNVVVRPSQPVPDGWEPAEHVAITPADISAPGQLSAKLRMLAQERRPVVFELDDQTGDALAVAERTSEPLHRLGPQFTFELSELCHLIWSNSIDGREPAGMSFALGDLAMAWGSAAVASAGRGDVVLADGSTVWLDGGPIRYTAPIDGIPVLHRVAIEHRCQTPFRSNENDADLASDQLAAVTHPGGTARVIAPAGSGKTRVLTERARHLLNQWRLPATAVCLVAFNKRAQEEMSERVNDLRGLQVRTLNAIALAIVNGNAPFASQATRVATLNEIDVRKMIGKLVEFPRKRNSDPIALWIEALSLARLGLREPSDVEALYDGDVDGFAAMLPLYRAELRRANAVDFDEQIVRAIELLLADPETRAAAQRACRLLLVDEFQDLTPAHVLLVRLLAGADGAVFGVGDDDQTIYGYNGADPSWLIDFSQHFPHAGDHPLEVNYRCPADVVAAAAMLLRHNSRRVPKAIRPSSTANGLVVEPLGDALATTTKIVADSIADGVTTSDIAVLTRVNSMLAPVQVALAHAGIATHGGVGLEFVERTAVRASLAWLRLATAGETLTKVDLAEALRSPSRPLRTNIATWVTEQSSVAGLRRLAGRLNTPRDSERVEGFATDIERLQALARSGASSAVILATVHDSMGMASTLSTLDTHRKGMNRAAQSDDLTAVAQLAALQPDPQQFEAWLRGALARSWQADGVTLATVHRVKGKEWPVVIVHHAEGDQFPHRLATDVEEERRVFHVAVTRGRHRVHIVPDEHPSPFIAQCFAAPDLNARRTPSAAPIRSAEPKQTAAPLAAADAALFEQLRVVRRQLAAGKPAFTVVSDQVLRDIAGARPTSLAALANIKGMGPVKLERYGDELLAVVEAGAV